MPDAPPSLPPAAASPSTPPVLGEIPLPGLVLSGTTTPDLDGYYPITSYGGDGRPSFSEGLVVIAYITDRWFISYLGDGWEADAGTEATPDLVETWTAIDAEEGSPVIVYTAPLAAPPVLAPATASASTPPLLAPASASASTPPVLAPTSASASTPPTIPA